MNLRDVVVREPLRTPVGRLGGVPLCQTRSANPSSVGSAVPNR